MYVKLYNRILDSSLAENRPLRHFFTDLLLCADPDGNVIMTKAAIANRTRATLEEVEFGIEGLTKPDPSSLSPEFEGRRIIPLDGHGYGWKIVNYAEYRDMKTAQEMRAKTADRVRRHREKVKEQTDKKDAPKRGKAPSHQASERAFTESLANGEPEEEQNKIVTNSLPEQCREAVLPSDQVPDAGKVMVLDGTSSPELVVCDRCHETGHKGEDCPIPMHLDAGKWVRD